MDRKDLSVMAGCAIVTAACWLHILNGAGTGMSVRAMTTFAFPPPVRPDAPGPWSAAYWGLMLAMWWTMMIAMMTPAFLPKAMAYRRAWRGGQAGVAAFALVGGFFLVWLGYSMVATAAQYALEQLGALHSAFMWSINLEMSALILAVAAAYQFTGAKRSGLSHCRSGGIHPLVSDLPGWIAGGSAGLSEGMACLRNCWALMALLFVGGSMNLAWIVGLTVVVSAEKHLGAGIRFARAVGVALLIAAVWVAFQATR